MAMLTAQPAKTSAKISADGEVEFLGNSDTATIVLDGGELVDEWDEETGRVFMTGPAAMSFEGETTL